MINRFFRLEELGTTVKTEVLAGLTTFLTMAYIIVLQPMILSGRLFGFETGMDFGAVMTATCLAAALATVIMGLYARYPIGQAPGMGENFFFLTAVVGMGISWEVALAAVFVSGGPMEAGCFRGSRVCYTDLIEAEARVERGEMSVEELAAFEQAANAGPGACALMGTANCMNMLTEALGMTMTDGALTPATHGARVALARQAGQTPLGIWTPKRWWPVSEEESTLRAPLQFLQTVISSICIS